MQPQAKVYKKYLKLVVVDILFSNHNIGRFYVVVNKAQSMESFNSVNELEAKTDYLAKVKQAHVCLDDLREIFA